MAIYIPKRINVGFQERKDTYTGKLAYVIYYDEKGVLRKEHSWNSWRDEKIPNNEYDNVPTEGFVLNKKVGDYSNGWDHRMSYCRVYDPRGFEFEITIDNLLYILENATSTVGKGLEGTFVYGWNGKDLILMPTGSPDYQDIIKYSAIVNENNYITAKDLKIGATYLGKDKYKYIYMGRYDKYEKKYHGNDKYVASVGKHYVFSHLHKNWEGKDTIDFDWCKSLGKKLISCIDEKYCDDYAELFDKLESTSSYSPVDPSKEKHIYYSFDRFKKRIDQWSCYVFSDCGRIWVGKKDGLYYLDADAAMKCGFAVTPSRNWYGAEMIPVPLEKIYEKIKPYYKKIYLANGKLCREEG